MKYIISEELEIRLSILRRINGEDWNLILDKMIRSFEMAINSDFMTEEESEDFREGFNLFNEYFFALWW